MTILADRLRLHVGNPDDVLSIEDVVDFAACERLINGIFRLSETGQREVRHEYFTEDTTIDMEYRDEPTRSLHVGGKAEMLAWYDRASRSRLARNEGPRLHVNTNFVWARRSADEVECNNLLTYYEFAGSSSEAGAATPRLIADCLHRFRREDGAWRMSYKYYWVLYSALSIQSIVAEA